MCFALNFDRLVLKAPLAVALVAAGILTPGTIDAASAISVPASNPSVAAVCGNEVSFAKSVQSLPLSKKPPPPPPPPVLPSGARMWETIPGVIRNDGLDTFRVEVNVNGVVSNVTMTVWDMFAAESGLAAITLHDNGLNGDRVAGDGIFTSELIRFNTNALGDLAPNYEWDTNSPAGVMSYTIGWITIAETNGTQSQFLVGPTVGILDRNIPIVPTVQLSSNVLISPHLFNVLGTNLFVQKILRSYVLETGELPKKIYSVFPDAFDFFVYFSTYRMEYMPPSAPDTVIGIHQSLQVDFTGTGQAEFNDSSSCGSAGRLLGINALDSYKMTTGLCTHEILHQWGSYMPAFPFSDGEHYVSASNVGSPLGGSVWDDNGDGSWTLDCAGGTELDPFDQYLLGLIGTNAVPPLRVYSSTSNIYCGGVIASNIITTTTIQDIVNIYGQRIPGPTSVRRNFSIGFVAESNRRLLNPIEMTYYEIFAGFYTKPIPPEQPSPAIGSNWVPISRFFPGTTWGSDVLALVRPAIRSLQPSANSGWTVHASGYSNQTYRLLSSTNFRTWSAVTSGTASASGDLVVTDTNSSLIGAKFYRLAWP
jgi:hypothetical protein